MNKIFSIGFNKTGTTTLEKCLKDLGFLPQAAWGKSNKLNHYWFEGNYEPIIDFAKPFRSLSDSPWNFADFYKTLDDKFPNSKFILTIRESNSWFQSLRKWCTPRKQTKTMINSLPDGAQFHKAIFGNTDNSFEHHECYYKKVYEQRNQDIIRHFKDRPDDLLVIDWTKHGWQELGQFLGCHTPDGPIPHLNKGIHKRY